MRIVVLDSGPLGLAAGTVGRPRPDQCRAWLAMLEVAGALIAVPEIADYEVRRELVRTGAKMGVARLNAIKARFLYVPITTGAMLKAADLWAVVRSAGTPTAAPDALDGDCIVAPQPLAVAGPNDVLTVATSNVGHLVRFPGLDARDWETIGA